VGKTGKKNFDERLQEVRNPRHDKVQYLKRKQQEEDAEKQLKEYERRRTER
jgi:hypothetical protein